MTVILFVSTGDKLSDLCNALKELAVPGVNVTIKQQCQVNDVWTHSGAGIVPFEGTVADVLEYLDERAHAATGYPNSAERCEFRLPTTIEITK